MRWRQHQHNINSSWLIQTFCKEWVDWLREFLDAPGSGDVQTSEPPMVVGARVTTVHLWRITKCHITTRTERRLQSYLDLLWYVFSPENHWGNIDLTQSCYFGKHINTAYIFCKFKIWHLAIYIDCISHVHHSGHYVQIPPRTFTSSNAIGLSSYGLRYDIHDHNDHDHATIGPIGRHVPFHENY